MRDAVPQHYAAPQRTVAQMRDGSDADAQSTADDTPPSKMRRQLAGLMPPDMPLFAAETRA
jgi:hypothetical protein